MSTLAQLKDNLLFPRGHILRICPVFNISESNLLNEKTTKLLIRFL